MPSKKSPNRGSLGYWPRVRARRIYPELEAVESDKLKPLGFAGYKVGMVSCVIFDNKKGSPTFGQEIVRPATVLDCPPLKVLGIRAYEKTVKGLKALSEAWINNLPKYTDRKIIVGNFKTEEKLKEIENNLHKISKIRLIVSTQPRESGINKKTPEIFEIEIGGKDSKEKFEYAKSLLGKEIKISDVFREGELIDVIAVTKGKGTQGPVKRFGVRIQNRHAKKKLRHVGSIGQQQPGKVRHTVPMAGQMGFHVRTELNKRILKIGNGKEINPSGGFINYGLVKSDYVLIEGSVAGSKKRLIMLRHPVRPYNVTPVEVREIIK
jgi:large subunit ribosomal protein L3